MDRIEKYRKIAKLVQYIGMAIILLGGVFLVYWFGIKNASDTSMMTSLTYCMMAVCVLMVFMMVVMVPMQAKLLDIIIEESLNGLVSNVNIQKKKGFARDQFQALSLTGSFSQYGCQNYYNFEYLGQVYESVTVRAYDEVKVAKVKGVKGSKTHKDVINHFLGRVYIIPFGVNEEFNVYGKKVALSSKKKEMEDKELNKLVALKVKKQAENFEVFAKEDNLNLDIQKFVDKLLTLKLQAKGIVSLFAKNNSMILCIDNGKYYKEVDIKNPIDESIVKDYRKDVSMVLNFINALKKDIEEK